MGSAPLPHETQHGPFLQALQAVQLPSLRLMLPVSLSGHYFGRMWKSGSEHSIFFSSLGAPSACQEARVPPELQLLPVAAAPPPLPLRCPGRCAWPAQLYAPLCAFTRDPALDLYLYNLGAYVCNPGKFLVVPSSVTSCVSPATFQPPRLIFLFVFLHL